MNSNDANRVKALKTTEMCTLMVNMANFMFNNKKKYRCQGYSSVYEVLAMHV